MSRTIVISGDPEQGGENQVYAELREELLKISREFYKSAPKISYKIKQTGETAVKPEFHLILESLDQEGTLDIPRIISLISNRSSVAMRQRPRAKSDERPFLERYSDDDLVNFYGIFNNFFSKLTISQYNDDDNRYITDREAVILSKFQNLKELTISHNRIGDLGAVRLAENKNLKVLRIPKSFGEDQVVGHEGARALSEISLIELDLKNNSIGNAGAEALSRSRTLKILNVKCNVIGEEGAIALARNTTLEYLNISNCDIGDEGAIALARNTTLEYLNVANCDIGDEGAIALANNKTLKQLRIIDYIGHDTFVAFAQNTTLQSLKIGADDITEESKKAIYRNTTLTELRLYDIYGRSRQVSNRNKIFKTITTKIIYKSPILYVDGSSSFHEASSAAGIFERITSFEARTGTKYDFIGGSSARLRAISRARGVAREESGAGAGAGAGSSAMTPPTSLVSLNEIEKRYLRSITSENALMLVFNIEVRLKQNLRPGDTINYEEMINAIEGTEFGKELLIKATKEIDKGITETISVPSEFLQSLLQQRYNPKPHQGYAAQSEADPRATEAFAQYSSLDDSDLSLLGALLSVDYKDLFPASQTTDATAHDDATSTSLAGGGSSVETPAALQATAATASNFTPPNSTTPRAEHRGGDRRRVRTTEEGGGYFSDSSKEGDERDYDGPRKGGGGAGR
jgi:hypothetical protein